MAKILRSCILVVLIALILLPYSLSAQHLGSDIGGRWKGSDKLEYAFQTKRDGQVTMQVFGHKTRHGMEFKGKFASGGFTISALPSVDNISSELPLKVRQQLVNSDYKFRYSIKLENKSTITLTQHGDNVTYDATTLKIDPIKFDAWIYPITLTRVTNLPDLRVTEFTAVAQESAFEGNPYFYWKATAKIKNTGKTDISERFAVGLERGGFEGKWIKIANSGKKLQGIKSGDSISFSWNFGKPKPKSGELLVSDAIERLRIKVDIDDQIKESDEENNFNTLFRLSCDPPDQVRFSVLRSLWANELEGKSLKAKYDVILDKFGKSWASKKLALLCYIRLEANRLAKLDKETVRGSNFLKALETHFLKDYLILPTKPMARLAIIEIGDHQVHPVWGTFAKIGLPDFFSKRYPALRKLKYLVPATEFYNAKLQILGIIPWSADGKNLKKMSIIDVPFLIGDPGITDFKDDDLIVGGKNATQAMHWATGVKYHYLPKNALREFFIGYEYWHLEGIDIFGEDAINDLIAEEQGRIFGGELAAAKIKNREQLIASIDRSFRRSRAWVGKMLMVRRKEFDKQILADEFPTTLVWWGNNKNYPDPGTGPPWSRAKDAETVSVQLSYNSVRSVASTNQVKHLIAVYQIMYSTREWDRIHGEELLTLQTIKVLEGKYNGQFKASPTSYRSGPNWKP